MDSKSSHIIVNPSLLYSSGVDASRPMSEELNYVHMHLFDNKNHESQCLKYRKVAFMNGDEGNDIENLLLLASQVYIQT